MYEQWVSRYEGDLVAKCYFAKHKLVWEVLDGGLKSKIEIQWSDTRQLSGTPDKLLQHFPCSGELQNPYLYLIFH